jgi:predicted ATPase
MTGAVVGRDVELASLHDFVASASDGAAALVLGGEAGMGKTTLWGAGLGVAEEAGFRVLRARPSESETTLSFSGIGDVLDPVLDRVLACLPEAQRRALSRALVLDDEDGPSPDPHAVGVAVLGAVRELAGAEPLVIAVDDVQWLDEASSAALAYAARRLETERVGVLLARRTPLESTLVVELRRSLPANRFTGVEVGPLDAGSLHRVVHDQLGVVVPRPLLAEVHQAAGGNPFYVLEIVRMLRRTGVSVEAGHPLPVPESLHDLVHGRLLELPLGTRDFLAAAAAHAHPTVALTEAI